MATKSGFPGFSPEALDFFRDLENNNNREWFQPRKEHFEQTVRDPMLQLVDLVNRELVKFAPEHVTDPKKAIFRIYRDTRFSHDKTPYKTHIAASFTHCGMEKMGAAGFYFSFNHKVVEIAGGLYHPSPEVLLAVRTHIAKSYDEFERLLKDRKLRKRFGELKGEELSRVPKGFDAEHPAAHLIKKKDWVLWVEHESSMATTPKFAAEVVAAFEVMAPFMEYLNRPLVAKNKSSKKAAAFSSE